MIFFTLDMAVVVCVCVCARCDVIEQFTIRSSFICVFVIPYKTLNAVNAKNEYLPKLIHSQNDDDDDDCWFLFLFRLFGIAWLNGC